MNTWVAVFLGRGCGSVMRYGISRLLVALPFCGGFSPFSAFSHENFLLYRDGMGMALLNIAVSVLACMAVFFLIAHST